ncbi:DUF1631 family protein [Rubrivivax rivuli]|uniref:DUF1631 family protein n=1 Tax=Rubrivivax rivuli TaxID=1862385 RepID=A0A437R9E5_9BURK|nr:DUF1631 family protein [Rubrivivax rivuli]RVU43327.1 DUF1631 family protein [Rubrivivax rivuli]
MVQRPLSPAMRRFVDDELLRAPLLFDQLLDGTLDHTRKSLPTMAPLQRATTGELMQAMLSQRRRLGDYFMRSLQEQVDAELQNQPRHGATASTAPRRMSLALVDEEVVAMDVELSHIIEAIKSNAEYELRELQTYISALVGDMDVSVDHNPFRAETYARATWAAAQALPLSRGHQLAFMRSAGPALAQLLRTAYAASSSRLDAMGIEPAAHRTVILPSGTRRGSRSNEVTFSPDLHSIRDTMPGPIDAPLSYEGQGRQPGGSAASTPAFRPAGGSTAAAPGTPREHWTEIARTTSSRVDRQSIELVSRLFDAMLTDERVPEDVRMIISRLHGPAMRLALRDSSLLDRDKHPLWRFINRMVFECEMAPDPSDPERRQLLKTALGTAEQLVAEPEQNNALYRWALDRFESYLHKRLTRRLAAAASQIGALQKLEDKLLSGRTDAHSSFHGMLDVEALDTVPADLMEHSAPISRAETPTDTWLDGLRPGDWVRMFLQGRWVQARLLWPGERGEVFLFGDGASDTTWAVRRGALLAMHAARLAKSLKERSIVGSAAARVQEQMASAAA